MKTRAEVDDLKRQWKDCGGDFPIQQEGFEEYTDELRKFEEESEAEWRLREWVDRQKEMRAFGLDPQNDGHKLLFAQIKKLEYRIAALERWIEKEDAASNVW